MNCFIVRSGRGPLNKWKSGNGFTQQELCALICYHKVVSVAFRVSTCWQAATLRQRTRPRAHLCVLVAFSPG